MNTAFDLVGIIAAVALFIFALTPIIDVSRPDEIERLVDICIAHV